MLFTPKFQTWRDFFLYSPADETSGQPQDAGADDGETPETETPDENTEEFDQERAMATIKAQRDAERKLAKELKDARATLAKFEAAEKAKADAEKTELQKAQDKAQALEAQLREAQELYQATQIQLAFKAAAATLKLEWASPQAADDAFELAELDEVEIDANGKVTGLEKALKVLQKDRPYLFKDKAADGTPNRTRFGQNSTTTNPTSTSPLTSL